MKRKKNRRLATANESVTSVKITQMGTYMIPDVRTQHITMVHLFNFRFLLAVTTTAKQTFHLATGASATEQRRSSSSPIAEYY